MCRIGIIDTGIQADYQSKKNKLTGYTLKLIDGKIQKQNNCEDHDGHGTAVTCILEKQVADSAIVMIKIDADSIDRYGFSRWLCGALEYIYEKEEFDIINLSCGFTQCDKLKELSECCQKLRQKGTLLVSAYSNDGIMTYPACLDSVIGIDQADRYVKLNQYDYIDSVVNIRSALVHWKLPKIKNYKDAVGNSFNTPYFTGIIAKMLKSGVSPEQVIDRLKSGAVSVYSDGTETDDNVNDCLLSIHKAIAFPFNKEVSVLARNEDILHYEILGYYDEPKLGKVGQPIGKLLNCGNNKAVLDFNKLIWNDDFDTVILGHCHVLCKLTGRDIIKEIIEKCLKTNKNLYLFDELDDSDFGRAKEQFSLHHLWIKRPQKITSVHTERGGKLYDIACPVVCVAGTDSNQGKFTVQLALRRYISDSGYRVMNLGTEPSSELLGLEGMYTLGYSATMPYSGWKNIIAVNQTLHNIEKRSPEMIITGSQARTVPYKAAAFSGYPIKQYEFIMGCAPDAYVLCINVDDNYDTIKRTIHYLESIFPSKVIHLCVNDIEKKCGIGRRWLLFMKYLFIYKKKTAFVSNDKTLRKVAKKCIKYFV